MKQYSKMCTVMLMVFVAMMFASCSKKQIKMDETMTDTVPPAVEENAAEQAAPDDMAVVAEGELEESDVSSKEFQEIPQAEAQLLAVFRNIYFDFDDFSLRAESKAVLSGMADWLLKNPAAQIMIEGHCDERGTNEYNLALGERRASSAKKYLVQLGVAPKRIFTISYGEEKPDDPGHDRAAWSKNRRNHFLIR